jgi:serine/threonine protein phosphatase PrpC
VVNGNECTIGNCGDSRVVVGIRARPGGPLKAKDLSTDHTPLLPVEKARIEAAGGWVAQDDEESEARVWLDRQMSCGLAMSRSLGDLPFKPIGKTCAVKYHQVYFVWPLVQRD